RKTCGIKSRWTVLALGRGVSAGTEPMRQAYLGNVPLRGGSRALNRRILCESGRRRQHGGASRSGAASSAPSAVDRTCRGGRPELPGDRPIERPAVVEAASGNRSPLQGDAFAVVVGYAV